jgi:circadian clock protein KaiB
VNPGHEQDAVPHPATNEQVLCLRLYVVGRSPNSVRALANLRIICDEYAQHSRCDCEVVDVLLDPLRAMADKILVTPTLVKLTPPILRIVGDLSEREKVLDALGLASAAP